MLPAKDHIVALLQGNCAEPIPVQGGAPRMGLQSTICNQGLSMLNFSPEQSFTVHLQTGVATVTDRTWQQHKYHCSAHK